MSNFVRTSDDLCKLCFETIPHNSAICPACDQPLTAADREPAFAAKYFDLPKPAPLEVVERQYGLPLEPGDYEYGYSFVAEDGRITAMGPTVTVNLKRNSNIGVRLAHDLWTRAVGIMLWCRRLDTPATEYDWGWRPAGAQSNCNEAQATPAPYLPMAGWEHHLLQAQEIHRCVWNVAGQGWYRYEERDQSPEAAPLYAPTILIYHVPPVAFDVRIRYIGNAGESEASEPVTAPGNTGDYHSPFELVRVEKPPYMTLGMYLEMKPTGTENWYRQKNPAQTDYDWPFGLTRFAVNNYTEEYPIIDEVAPGRHFVDSLTRCLNESTKHVIIDSDITIYGPVFNPLDNAQGTAIHRIIQGEQGLGFKIKTSNTLPDGTVNPHTRWPVFVEGSYGTIINGMNIDSDTAETAIEFCSYNGSTGYTRINNPVINLGSGGYTAGIRQLHEARSSNNHTASEVIITNPRIGAAHPYVLEGVQSANWEIRNGNSNAHGNNAAHGSIGNSGSVRFTGQTIMEGGRSALAILSARHVKIENLFSDAGFPSFACVSGRSAPIIEINLAVPNQHAPWLHPLEAPCAGRGAIEFHLTGRMDADGYEATPGNVVPMNATIYTTRYVGCRYRIGCHIKFSSLKLSQPTMAWWNTATADYALNKTYFQTWDNNVDPVNTATADTEYGLTSAAVPVTP